MSSVAACGRRDGLRLSLNRSLSEPGPPKRCKAGSTSLPASPCAESLTLHRSLLLKKVRLVTPEEVSHLINHGGQPPLILDCRSFLAYNVCHIRGAINVNCSDRFNRRRLETGKASLAELATSREAKELLRKRTWRSVLVYDDCTAHVDRLTNTHPMFLVLTALVEDNREPLLLIGEQYTRINVWRKNSII
ncbi:hypothetical protein AAG570_010950 [Ranatra chinensis]|uniref:Rhodanese domain-containing protein n=1 Tax=Ranatra chinensis TaxID=642074 RepID=A0ABD0YXK6_9HEMI